MEIKIESKKNNPLFNRTEVHFTISHEGEGTPNREIIRNELADKLNTKKENIIVNNISSSFGSTETVGYAKVYTSLKQSKGSERKHFLLRNKLITEEKKKGDKKTEEPAPTPSKSEEPAGEPKEEVAAKPPKEEEKVEEAPVEDKIEETPPAEDKAEEAAPSEEKVEEPAEQPKEEKTEETPVEDKTEETPPAEEKSKEAEKKEEKKE